MPELEERAYADYAKEEMPELEEWAYALRRL